jgi:phasin family protein
MIDKIEQLADNLKAESRLFADRAVASLRAAGLETASLLNRTKAPVHAIADTGLKINALSHKGIEKLLKQQVIVFEDLVDGSARRLEMAARAKTVRALLEDQIAMLPMSREHAVANARKTVEIVRDTGESIGEAVKGVMVEFSAPPRGRPARKKATASKAPARKRATTAKKKATTRGRTAKKATAKKAA